MTNIMPSDAAIVALCADIYRPTAIAGTFDHYDAGMDDGICWALKRLEGFDVVIFRGSVTLRDWWRDFCALATPSRIGHVHTGFHAGMEHMWTDLKPMLSQPTIVTGHSLGAARADVLAALMTVDGVPPVARVVFGEPKPGLLDFARLIAGITGRSYRNGDSKNHDLITDLPFSFPPDEYVHPTPIVPVSAEPSGDLFGKLGMFAYHHIELYEVALNRVGSAG
jgi:Lipase (class 3)